MGGPRESRLVRALQEAKLKLSQACIEAVDYPARRELDTAVIRRLATAATLKDFAAINFAGGNPWKSIGGGWQQ